VTDLQGIAESLAAQLGRSVAIDDLNANLLVHTSHVEPVDQFRIDSIMLRHPKPGRSVTSYAEEFGIAVAGGPVRIPASEDLGSLARVCVPVRCQGMLLGYLWMFDGLPELTGGQLEQASQAAGAAGEVLFRERLLDDLRRGAQRELLRDLLNPAEEVRRYAASRLVSDHDVPPGAGVQAIALVADPGGDDVGAVDIDLALLRATRQLAPATALSMATSGTSGILLLVGSALPRRQALRAEAERIRTQLAVARSGARVVMGIGAPRQRLDESAASYHDALEATRVARLVPSVGQTAFADELGVYGLLARLPLDSIGPNAIPPGLRTLLADKRHEILVHTLAAYLDAAGDPVRTAGQLVIHRSTLYYRLERISELTGMNLRDGNDRLALHLGLKIVQLRSYDAG
jgi:PucR C-terminal helix-turn-helix domain